jgi:hypothetical protein
MASINVAFIRQYHFVIQYLLNGAVLFEKLIRFSASQEISRILWNPKVHYRLPTAPILRGSLSPRHGASSGCVWKNGLQIWRVLLPVKKPMLRITHRTRCFLWRQNNPEVNYFPLGSPGGVFLEEVSRSRKRKRGILLGT